MHPALFGETGYVGLAHAVDIFTKTTPSQRVESSVGATEVWIDTMMPTGRPGYGSSSRHSSMQARLPGLPCWCRCRIIYRGLLLVATKEAHEPGPPASRGYVPLWWLSCPYVQLWKQSGTRGIIASTRSKDQVLGLSSPPSKDVRSLRAHEWMGPLDRFTRN